MHGYVWSMTLGAFIYHKACWVKIAAEGILKSSDTSQNIGFDCVLGEIYGSYYSIERVFLILQNRGFILAEQRKMVSVLYTSFMGLLPPNEYISYAVMFF